MKDLKIKIRELLPKMHFLDKVVLKNIESNLDSFGETELQNVYELLRETNEKTINHFDVVLQQNPRFFEQAKGFLMKKKEERVNIKDKAELVATLNKLRTI